MALNGFCQYNMFSCFALDDVLVGYVIPKHVPSTMAIWVTDIFCFLPVKISLGIQLGTICRSSRGVRTPSRFPNMEDRPRLKSMTKKSTAHTCEPGILMTASVNTMKARPVPDALCGTDTQWTYICLDTLTPIHKSHTNTHTKKHSPT